MINENALPLEVGPGINQITWKEVLNEEKQAPYFKSILNFIERERAAGKIIYPANNEIFNALTFTPFHEIKVVILGQDPYHGPQQAHGLCFSVRDGVPFPPSLHNIFQELNNDLGSAIPQSGCLERWAKQGVLLLNASLSVEAGKPQSHSEVGWERFTDRIIKEISQKRDEIIFLLWGAFAQKKGALIDRERHFVFEAAHPSPLSAYKGFFGCKHFSKTNELLRRLGKTPIDW